MGRAGKIAVHLVLAMIAWVAGESLANGSLNFASLQSALLFAGCALIAELFLQVERAPWRFLSVGDMLRLSRSTAVTTLLFIPAALALQLAIPSAYRTVLLAMVLNFVLLAGLRIFRRALNEGSLTESLLRLRPSSVPPISRGRLLIVGSASEADAFLRAPPSGLLNRYTTIGIISPQDREVGEALRGVCVLGGFGQFDAVLGRLRESGLAPAAVLFLVQPAAIAAMGAERLGRLKGEGVRLLRQPAVIELSYGVSAGDLREISLQELLTRPPVRLEFEPGRILVAGRRVLITGAGGSIGSEISRQIAACGASHISLLDSSEAALFRISREIEENWPGTSRADVLCDIRDEVRLKEVFADEKPDLVFHAAALKHVPLVEAHPCEGVRTNVFGALNVAEAARVIGATHMAFISTDKAVNPSSVMGATKRLAEALIRQAGGKSSTTRFSIVRFGNVLGSAGSVATVFQQQIERGGPVTVTDEAMERYFMTIPEAVQLVLRAVAMSAARSEPEPGVLTLEMGEPVKIIDLARRMIELQGFVPDKDIEIRVIGLRPGEKITEELVDVNEEQRMRAPGVIEAAPRTPPPQITPDDLARLRAEAMSGDQLGVRDTLFGLIERIRSGVDLPAGNVTPLRRPRQP
jgi:O-antigen biosynthesis protein WbqV